MTGKALPMADTIEQINAIRRQVRELVCAVVPAAGHLSDGSSLFEAGLIDSLAFLNIVRAIEAAFATPLHAADIALADLTSIDGIAACVATRLRPVGDKAEKRA